MSLPGPSGPRAAHSLVLGDQAQGQLLRQGRTNYAGTKAFTRRLEGQAQLTRSEWPRQGTSGAKAEVLEDLEVWRTFSNLVHLGAVG